MTGARITGSRMFGDFGSISSIQIHDPKKEQQRAKERLARWMQTQAQIRTAINTALDKKR